MTKIALIEVTDFHDECLFSQIEYLKSPEVHITLICNAKLANRVNKIKGVDKYIFIDLSSKLKKYKAWISIWFYVKNNVSKVIFNTAENYIFKLLFLPFKNVELIGILHNGHKLKRKKQKIISKKLDKYFVLGHFIKRSIKKEGLTQNPVGVFYPILFPEYKTVLNKPENEIWITIPGAVESDKRDYSSLYELLLPKNVKLILLGAAKTEAAKFLLKKLSQSKLEDNLMVFDKFIPNEIFHAYIEKSDFILPLIHPCIEQFSHFLNYKISGSYNLAIGYRKPLLLEKSLKPIEELNDCANYYDSENMNSILSAIEEEKDYYKSLTWSKEHQRKAFLDFVFG